MKNCLECHFMTDYGEFLYCEIKREIIRHEIREALFCRYYPLTHRDLCILDEFLDNYPGREEITSVELFNRYGGM